MKGIYLKIKKELEKEFIEKEQRECVVEYSTKMWRRNILKRDNVYTINKEWVRNINNLDEIMNEIRSK